jgi:flagellar hook-associated protein 2
LRKRRPKTPTGNQRIIMTISSAGVGSGLDVESIVAQLVALEKQPITKLQSDKTRLQTQLSNFGKLQSSLSTLRDAARKLFDAPTWNAVTAASSDTTAVGVTVNGTAAPSTLKVQPIELATAQQAASAAFANPQTVIGQGTLTIDLGNWNTAQTAFTQKAGSTSVTIAIGPEDNTLEKIRDKINAAKPGVSATIVNDITGSRLAITSSETGAANGFRIQVADTDGTGTDATGLSRLAFDPAGGAASMTRNQAGGDATALINGLTVTTASNTLVGVVDGVTLQLNKVLTATTASTISVTQDNESIRKSITDFATAYNDSIKFLREQTLYNADSKVAGSLQGDRTAVSMQQQLRTLISGTSGASTMYQRLADIGLDPQADGSLKVSTSKLDTALTHISDLKAMFSNVDDAVPGNNGLATQLRQFVDLALGSEGPLTSRQEGLRTRMTLNDKRQDQLEDRVALVEKRLRAQYTSLDTQMGKLSSLSNYMTQQLALLNRNS